MAKKHLRLFSREIYILLLSFSIFISISVFEILLVLGLIFTFYEIVRKKLYYNGILSKPLIIFSTVTVLSTVLFNPSKTVKSIEEGIFQLIYFFNIKSKNLSWLRDNLLKVFIVSGILLLPVLIYRFSTEGKALLLWGSAFETGHFYSIFSILSLVLAVYFKKKKINNLFYLFLGLFVVFSLVITITFRRTIFLEFFAGTIFLLVILYRSKLINKIFTLAVLAYLILFSIADYVFLSKYDYRIKEMNKVFIGKSVNINTISSSRYAILKDAIEIIKTDIKEKHFLNMLIGHGIRPGNYLPHIYDKYNRERYESFFIVSEFIERGIVGVFAILWIMISSFKSFFSITIKKLEDIKALVFVLPLVLHLIGTLFTFFWDALLPLYFLLFKIGEVYFGKNKTV